MQRFFSWLREVPSRRRIQIDNMEFHVDGMKEKQFKNEECSR
jgi:hypothetical protein